MGFQEKMEGWLCLMRLNRFGLQCSRKRYFILEDNCLKNFKFVPTSPTEESVRSAIIDSCICVTDNGRETFHRKVIFAPCMCYPFSPCIIPLITMISSRLSVSKSIAHKSSMDMAAASFMHVHAMTFDVIAPSPWKIFGCQNGLQLFKEAKDKGSNGKQRDGSPAVMAVGVIEGTSEAIFRTHVSWSIKNRVNKKKRFVTTALLEKRGRWHICYSLSFCQFTASVCHKMDMFVLALKLGIDVGSSTVARCVVSLVLGYLNNLVIEMAFLIQGNTPEELPKFLLGTCRLNHLDVSKSIQQTP
ncbi:hypothetical protein RDI58_010550 [Solanum bulbocastanum]|uniref:Protein ENHANCED DISEASE RESISTANCE 2 C-terminal domain-containing protein n=1 Tax=Solanum bulbocastanum TaxID=147425 RepID=A0AAN8YFH9_SOLBU